MLVPAPRAPRGRRSPSQRQVGSDRHQLEATRRQFNHMHERRATPAEIPFSDPLAPTCRPTPSVSPNPSAPTAPTAGTTGLGTDRGAHFTVLLEYVPGGSITSLLTKFGPFRESVMKVGAVGRGHAGAGHWLGRVCLCDPEYPPCQSFYTNTGSTPAPLLPVCVVLAPSCLHRQVDPLLFPMVTRVPWLSCCHS